MECRTYKEDFKGLILNMIQMELENYTSQRGTVNDKI